MILSIFYGKMVDKPVKACNNMRYTVTVYLTVTSQEDTGRL